MRMDRIGSTATTVAAQNGVLRVTYHSTVVVEWNTRDSTVTLDSGGWQSATTKARMNQAANQFDLGFQVYQKDYFWFVSVHGQDLPFKDRMTFVV